MENRHRSNIRTYVMAGTARAKPARWLVGERRAAVARKQSQRSKILNQNGFLSFDALLQVESRR
jgi:hypothetical protein